MADIRTITRAARLALCVGGLCAGCAHAGGAGRSRSPSSPTARGWMEHSAVATAVPGSQGELPRVPERWSARGAGLAGPRGGGPQPPDAFAREVIVRLRDIEAQVRADVANMALEPQAIDEVAARRVLILRLLREDADDGVITPRERDEVAAVMRDMAERAYQYVALPYVWPGGAMYWRQ